MTEIDSKQMVQILSGVLRQVAGGPGEISMATIAEVAACEAHRIPVTAGLARYLEDRAAYQPPFLMPLNPPVLEIAKASNFLKVQDDDILVTAEGQAFLDSYRAILGSMTAAAIQKTLKALLREMLGVPLTFLPVDRKDLLLTLGELQEALKGYRDTAC